MSSLLHITNGDCFTEKLKTLNLSGDIITWREMLCEGKTETNVGSESFWKTRFEYLNKNYKVSKSIFIEKTLKEYRNLCKHKKQDQIVLWFDYDLYCQVNMLAVISWLKTHRKYAQISLVTIGDEKGTGNTKALSEVNDVELRELYENKIVLAQDDVEFADYIWQLYCSDNPIRLENVTDYNEYNFNYLGDSIQAHLRRFPSIKNGLNDMETNILNIALKKKPTSKGDFIKTILQNQGILGFSDLQYQKAIGRLKPLFSSFNPVRLTANGKSILKGETSYYSCIQENDVYLGGALKYNFLFNSTNNKILKL